MSIELLIQVALALLQLGALAVAYGKLNQKVQDIDDRVKRIERLMDDATSRAILSQHFEDRQS